MASAALLHPPKNEITLTQPLPEGPPGEGLRMSVVRAIDPTTNDPRLPVVPSPA